MGREIHQTAFSQQDFRDFSARLHQQLDVLRTLLQRPTFGRGGNTLGAELELYIIDGNAAPLCRNRELRDRAGDPCLALELNRYNLEYNFPVYDFARQPFRSLAAEMHSALQNLDSLAATQGGQIVPIGILPTLMESDLGAANMTPETRYQVLSDILIDMRGGRFDLDIDGEDQLHMSRQDITAEGVCTSFQVHFGFDIDEFVDIWNAMALVTPLVLAVGANSPLLFGRRLWHESRIPLFKQATDARREGSLWHDLPRVDLTRDWLRKSPWELFAQRVFLYPPLIPLCSEEDAGAVLAAGNVPHLHELNLHNGTIWHWNRPIYSNRDDGHIRIELRALPAGPSAIDMAANAAFHIGVAAGLKAQMDFLIPAMPFRFVAENFTAAARDGMGARLIWPSLHQNRLWDKPVKALGLSLLETAHGGLISLGIDNDEAAAMLGVIEGRLKNGQNGARWQLKSLENLRGSLSREDALVRLVRIYRDHALNNEPVHRWPEAGK